MASGFFRLTLCIEKSGDLFLAKFREWWTLQICHYDTMLVFTLLDSLENVEIFPNKIPQSQI